MKTFDTKLLYVTNSQLTGYGEGGGIKTISYGEPGAGECGLQLYDEPQEGMDVPRVFAIARQLEDDPAAARDADSLRLNVKGVAGQIVHVLKIDPLALQLILHFPLRAPHGEFSLIHLNWDGEKFEDATAENISRSDLEEMIGCKVETTT